MLGPMRVMIPIVLKPEFEKTKKKKLTDIQASAAGFESFDIGSTNKSRPAYFYDVRKFFLLMLC